METNELNPNMGNSEFRDKLKELLEERLDNMDFGVTLISVVECIKKNEEGAGSAKGLADEALTKREEWSEDKKKAKEAIGVYISILEKWENKHDELKDYCETKIESMKSGLTTKLF